MDEVFALYSAYIPHFFEDGMPLYLMLGGAFWCGKGKTNWNIPLQKYDGSDRCMRHTVCGHARQTLYISPESRMLPCMSLSATEALKDYPLISEIGLRQGLTESSYMSLIDTRIEDFLSKSAACSQCEYARICAGGCRASALSVGSSIMGPDPACCTLFKKGWASKIRAAAQKAVERLKA